jgi:hypothetical protein
MMSIPQLSKGNFSDWETIPHAFAKSPSLFMKQAWLGDGRYEERFRPAEVKVGWFDDRILVFAHLEDEEIHSDSTADNQHLWKLGDVFEMFLREGDRVDYYEFHVNPNGHRLQIRFTSPEDFRACSNSGSIESHIIAKPLFDFKMRTLPGAWEVFASLPFRVLNPDVESPAGRRILASFSRYDATQGMPPVLSSTSAHRVLSYHRQEEWTELYFQ